MKEICICAAIKDVQTGYVWNGHRHGHAHRAMLDELSWHLSMKEIMGRQHIQGFTTSLGRFVTREEGRQLQDSAGIPSIDKDGYRGKTLYSEDLYQFAPLDR